MPILIPRTHIVQLNALPRKFLVRDDFTDNLAAGAVDGTSPTPGPGGKRVVADTGNNISVGGGVATFAGGTGTWGQTTTAWDDPITRPGRYDRGYRIEFDIVADNDKLMWAGLATDTAPGDPTAADCEHAIAFAADGNLDIYAGGVLVKADAMAYVNGTTYRVRLVLYSTGCFYAISANGGLTFTALHENIAKNTATLYAAISNYNAVFTADRVRTEAALYVETFADYVTDISVLQARVLRNVFRATTGAAWTNKTNWLSTTTAGNWFGITVAGGHVTEINLNSNLLNGEWTTAMLTPLTGLTQLYAYTNVNLNCSFALSDLPAGIVYLHLGSTSSVITGALSDLPAGMMYLYLYATASVITGGAVAMTSVGIIEIAVYTCAMDQPTVDSQVLRLYTDRASFTYATPSLNTGGTNAAPTGIYQDGDPPTTGLEYIYELANDPEIENFKKWTITWNGGSAP